MTQRQFADYCGVTIHTVRKWELGKLPMGFFVMVKLQRLAEKANININDAIEKGE